MPASSFSKSQIDKLGKSLYEILSRNELPTNELLELLQTYRIQFKETLKIACEELTRILNKVDNTGIITYRVKRLESIFSKIKRQPDMKLSRMQDIAGARCILQNETKIRHFYGQLIRSNVFEISSTMDYIQNPKENGYKSLHVICKCNGLPIEIQLRDETQHAWATLVEITDQIYKTKLKELNDDCGTGLYDFLKILSKSKNLNLDERRKINECLQNNQFIQKLTSTFSENAIRLRHHWCNQKQFTGTFYLFEVDKKDRPNIKVFDDFIKAEALYFDNFTKDIKISEKNMVMAYISNSSFETISKAYSNYILIKHTFYDKLLAILANNSGDSLINSQSLAYIKLITHCRTYVNICELRIVSKIKANFSKNRKYFEWKNDIAKELNRSKKIPKVSYADKAKFNSDVVLYRRKIQRKLIPIIIRLYIYKLLNLSA